MGEALHYTLAPLRLAASAEDLDAWIAQARPGHMCIYARGDAGAANSAVGKRAAALRDAGIVSLHFRKLKGVGEYLAVKKRAADALPPPRFTLDGRAARVLVLLEAAADEGKPCPTNRTLALESGLQDEDAVRYQIKRLCEAGHITVDDRGRGVTRIVTIKASGKATSRAATPVGRGFQRVLDGKIPGIDG